ncbi:hypothetical protein [Dankookia sp. P2]|uniref:hypothetical protein n=1 Tax=Dankookia sp. P2 TaxID=3423955 RepID=UPI003D666A72
MAHRRAAGRQPVRHSRHGRPGAARGPGLPRLPWPAGRGIGAGARLAGREAAELDGLLRAYRTDQRQGTIMNRIARGYTEAELAAAAAYFAAVR